MHNLTATFMPAILGPDIYYNKYDMQKKSSKWHHQKLSVLLSENLVHFHGKKLYFLLVWCKTLKYSAKCYYSMVCFIELWPKQEALSSNLLNTMGPIENKVLKVAGNFKTHEYCKSNANENVIISTVSS